MSLYPWFVFKENQSIKPRSVAMRLRLAKSVSMSSRPAMSPTPLLPISDVATSEPASQASDPAPSDHPTRRQLAFTLSVLDAWLNEREPITIEWVDRYEAVLKTGSMLNDIMRRMSAE